MRWSKLKKLVEQRFSEKLKGRVQIKSTRYGNCTCGRAWLTIDGEEVANFCTRAAGNIREYLLRAMPLGKSVKNNKFDNMLVEYGEFTRQEVYKACWDFIHNNSFDESLGSENPLLVSLAVLDTRIGKRRLKSIDTQHMHLLPLILLWFRKDAEGIE